MIRHFTTTLRRSISRIMCAAMLPALLYSCSGGGATGTDETIAMAAEAIADGDYELAQLLCDNVRDIIYSADSASVDENQAAGLGILYMKLSEHRNGEDNVAEAMQCLRYAFRQSSDSLKLFSAGLPLEDERHFVLLRRLGLSLDSHPVDLTGNGLSNGDMAPDSIE